MSEAHRAAWEEELEEVKEDILGEGVVLSTTERRGTYDRKYSEWRMPPGVNTGVSSVDDGIAKVSVVEYVIAGTVTTCEVTSYLNLRRLFHDVVVGEIEVKRVPEPAAPVPTPRQPPARQADGWPSPSSPESLGHAGWFRLTPTEFEHAIAALCRRDGCTQVRTSGGPGDLGADVIARTPDGRKLVIQCKQYINKVGSPDVQKFAGTVFHHHRADVALLVTTSRLTAPAADYAHQVGIRTVDAERLDRWAKRVGPAPWK
ncbi:hypothetical protein SGFS_061820 [Streptomyces graminofaciens]|uniref:Restriction endonuclease type IV Mrr domain-containing protein n=2 Tax=Streptomyces graminofaciens TaxID=68212 RepID=A0ABM7FFK5_9ACTN|nr:hypothetical protein SGFS_061820 [Streptomyces graminofaciens]